MRSRLPNLFSSPRSLALLLVCVGLVVCAQIARGAAPEDERRRQSEVGEMLGRLRLLEILAEKGALTPDEERRRDQLKSFVDRECPDYYRQHLLPYLDRSLRALATEGDRSGELASARRAIAQMGIPDGKAWSAAVPLHAMPAGRGGILRKPSQSGLWLMVVWGSWSQTGLGRAWDYVSPVATDGQRMQYARLAETFDREKLDSAGLAEIAVKSRSDGVVMVVRHLDGVPYFVRRAAGLGGGEVDPARRLVDELRRRNLGVGLYYCLLSFRHPQSSWSPFHPRYVPAFAESYPDRWREFEQECLTDLEWLLTQYQPSLLWTDERWPAAQSKRLWEWIGSAKTRYPLVSFGDRGTGPHADFATPSSLLVGEGASRQWISVNSISNGPGSWYRSQPSSGFKDAYECLKLFVSCRAQGGRLALTIGPDANGQLPEAEARTLVEIGEWIGGPGRILREDFQPLPAEKQPAWGRTFTRGGSLAVFAFGAELPRDHAELSFHSPVPVKLMTLREGVTGARRGISFKYDATTGLVTVPVAAFANSKAIHTILVNAPLD